MQRIEEVKLTRSSIKWNKNTLKYKTLPFPRTLCCILGEKTVHAAFALLLFAPPAYWPHLWSLHNLNTCKWSKILINGQIFQFSQLLLITNFTLGNTVKIV